MLGVGVFLLRMFDSVRIISACREVEMKEVRLRPSSTDIAVILHS